MESTLLSEPSLLFSSTVTGKNQVTIPVEIARQMGITAGSKIEWAALSSGHIELRVLPTRAELAQKLRGSGRKYLRPGSDPIRELIEERVREDAEENL